LNGAGILAVAKPKEVHNWSSRQIASKIFSDWDQRELGKFKDYRQGYTGKSVITNEDNQVDADSMDVDEAEDDGEPQPISRRDARDLLHEQVGEQPILVMDGSLFVDTSVIKRSWTGGDPFYDAAG
jgi:hypothetical protein